MAISYLNTNIPVGNPVFGISTGATMQVWGAAFYDSRFLVVLAKGSDSVLQWMKIDTLSTSVDSYGMTYPVTALSIAVGDHTANGQFLAIDTTGGFIYYLKDTRLYKVVLATGAVVGTGNQTLKDSAGASLTAANLKAVCVKDNDIYVASTNGSSITIYRYNQSSWTWDASNKNATTQVVALSGSDVPAGMFIQSGGTDVVLLTKGASTQGIKYNSTLSTRIGTTVWATPATTIMAAQFSGTVLYTATCDSTQAGVGVTILLSGDGSTGAVAKEQTLVSVSPDKVKSASDTVITIKYIARDGYGAVFAPSESVRFTVTRVGDSFDKNDAALSLSSSGPFRTGAGVPLYTQLDSTFNGSGEATVYAQAPQEVPVETLLYRIKIKYPIFI